MLAAEAARRDARAASNDQVRNGRSGKEQGRDAAAASDKLNWRESIRHIESAHREHVQLSQQAASVRRQAQENYNKRFAYSSSAVQKVFCASQCGDATYIADLPESSTTVNDTQNGITPLIWAVYYGHIETVHALIAKGADVNARDKDGW